MALQLYNTLTRTKERFEPIDPRNVRMYVCGPTVYDLAHIGNARPIIVFDVLFRLLRHLYGPDHVTYARNITDVDDKINNRAVERFPDMEPTAAIRRLTEETAAQFHKDIAALGVLEPTVEPRATDHIEEMKALCEALVARGHAYVAEEHVLFDASSMADYGRLANRSLEEMEAGARVDVAPYKRGQTDFVLWKPSTPAQPGWPSPCGIATPGRPGWHIECSAMADHWLWSQPKTNGLLSEAGLARPHVFDIHGGGIDLVFPHHENEIAQSRCAHGTSHMARYWMHNGFLQVEGEKMSKSLGNFVTINELIATQRFGGMRWDGEVIRLAMLKTHYRQPIDWTIQLLQEASLNINTLASVRYEFEPTSPSEALLACLEDDLNTKLAIDELLRLAQRAKGGDMNSGGELVAGLQLLGILERGMMRILPPHTGDEFDSLLWPQMLSQFYEVIPRNATVGTFRIRELKLYPNVWQEKIISFLGCADDAASCGAVFGNIKRTESVNRLISARLAARRARDFKESDRIRDELAAMGVQLKDSKNKETGEIETTWEVKR
jgi:cysteinyl-tRNA synthetase